MKTTRLLVVIIVLQAVMILGQWTGQARVSSATAQAEAAPVASDPGTRQLAIIDELKELNSKMDKLIDIMGSGNLQVKVVPPDEKK